MFKMLFSGVACLAVISFTGCAPPPQPIKAKKLNSSKVIYDVGSAVYADSVRVKDLQGNTICLKRNVELTAPQTSANFGFCTIMANSPYDVETRVGKKTFIDRICATE